MKPGLDFQDWFMSCCGMLSVEPQKENLKTMEHPNT